jgi:hypothetical protein
MLNKTLLASANIRSDPIVVMQKLARTANDAQKPMPSTHDMNGSLLCPLVLRFRSSHHIAAPSFANFGIKGALANL